jgi:Ser/Thr protein kinase RdoA (MazF antagonist)
MLQLACAWNLAHEPVRCVAPTLIQESGLDARAVEDKRAELAALSAGHGARVQAALSAEEVSAIREIGENTGCMTLKGASPEHEGSPRPDRWALDGELSAVARRWRIDPRRDLGAAAVGGGKRQMIGGTA